ncbi:MAG: TolC family protein [Myxococcota bacterium]
MALAASPALAQVAVVADGPSDMLTARYEKFVGELAELSRDTANPPRLPAAPTHLGSFSLESARAQLQSALNDRSVRAIVGFGYFVGVAAAELKPFPKKPILLAYGAPEVQGLPQSGNMSGRRNLGYLSGLLELEKDLARFREVIRLRKVTFLVDGPVLAAVLSRASDAAFDQLDPDVRLVAMPDNAEGSLAAIPEGTEAVYLPPNFRMSFEEMNKLIAGLNARKLPTYAAMGPKWVERGAFVTLMPPEVETERFRRLALNLRDALAGDDPGRMAIGFPRRTELFINMDTARTIGVFPSFELMTEARLMRSSGDDDRLELKLPDVVATALERNPAFLASIQEVRAAEAELRESRGNLLPSIDLTGDFTWLDPDVATSLGSAETTLQWGASANQIVYSPLAFNAYFAQQKNVNAVEASLRAAELDLVLEAVQSFLSVLQARAVETLQRDNLRNVRTNRSLAELRVEIGSSGKQDVARWDISLADGRVNTISASAQRNQAEIDLNRILDADIERSFLPVLPEEGPRGLLLDPRLDPYVRDLRSFRIFRTFMAREALERSPELAQLDAQIAAQDKLLTGYTQQLYIPSLGVGAGFTHVLWRGGEGSGSAELPPEFSGAIAARDDFTWQLGANLTFALYDDVRYGTIERIRRVRSQLLGLRDNTANLVEQRVRSALHQTGASGAAVSLRQEAVRAARVNLDAVTSAYREGTATIITLIDAQTQSLQAEINAANALYQFLSDFAAAERAAGRFLFRAPLAEQNTFIESLERFAAKQLEAGAKE